MARAPDPRDEACTPPASVVHELHDRYLREVVEGLNLCPFARRSRELGRVERPLFWVDGDAPDARAVAERIVETCAHNPDVEIILLTFVVPEGHPWATPEGFDPLVRALREAYDAACTGRAPRFYMVPFHPGNVTNFAITPDSLVPLIRRTPDPVIQCVRAETLDEVRRQAQRAAEGRFREALAQLGPEALALAERSIQTDPELSSDIARHNFEAVGQGEGRARLEERILAILRARDDAYDRSR
ncbi:MAG: hypothetical protein R3A51_02430 [Nannocystaceae bacterium]|nr:hypothetical protein [Myxococcales bacterium]